MLLDQAAADTADLDTADAAPDGQAEPATPDIPAPEPETRVSLKPKSRRAQAMEETNKTLSELKEGLTGLKQTIEQRDSEIARLRMEVQQRPQPVYVPQPVQQQMPDPNQLMREAEQALDNKDLRTYHEKLRQANLAEMEQRLMPRLQQLQAPAQQSDSMPPALQAMFAAHPEVAMHPNHLPLLQAKTMELRARGFEPGPRLLKAAFEEVNKIVTSGKQQPGAQYDRGSAAVLSGVPTSRAPAGGQSDGPGVMLNSAERMVAKKFGMSEDEYARQLAEMHPERIQR
jgi:hypothetical protein